MEHSSRKTYEQRGDMRDDNTSTGGQGDNPISKGNQGKWEHRSGEEDTQYLDQSDYGHGTNTVGGGQTGTDPGGTQPDRYKTSGREQVTTRQTAGYTDPRNITGEGGDRRPGDDDEYGAAVGAGGHPVKQSMTSKVKGAAEKMAGKIMGDPGKQARGREREEGTF